MPSTYPRLIKNLIRYTTQSSATWMRYFIFFTKLPTEIRIQIRKLALLPIARHRPGAHFFGVTNKAADSETVDKLYARCNKDDCLITDDYNYGYGLVPPSCIPDNENYFWQQNNTSAYLWDFGIWSDAGLGGFRQITIEYEPVWNDVTKDTDPFALFGSKGPKGFFIRPLLYMANNRSSSARDWKFPFWLIDYSLKRKPETKIGKNVKRIYDMDRVFTEVTDETRQYYETDNDSALDFIHNLASLFGKEDGLGADPLDEA
ncbi:uncharacterized protein TRIVIDRAFT_70482 [Trichoderma virens Gv29-8]|uniref:Uncharacterized protein n=1 Tax=Hypocrea virens (strain Gv29-8 / FGSC 10586) TaxID=413071 RepID=G9MVQ0_HYPVG|nr:uncharacterized protein TRIVIDRAFT_70482 [Trichoderma virens Gv29-8]EHK21547.1 hypothetical protein TRIVIDRAFT_70482 [Trichoderma virens Gv29-8]UKZ53413.1 hypothetical protein TrVGV298_007205 [Trichoderma virens]